MKTPSATIGVPLTIVIPVRNREVIVERCLASLESQDIRPLKIVLVDNDSEDSTLSKLERWAERVKDDNIEAMVISEPRCGASIARNTGLGLVETPWVMFFDSDDAMPSNHISQVLQAARERPDAEIIGWDTLLHLPGDKKRRSRFPSRHLHRNALLSGNMSTQSYAVLASLARNCGGWDEELSCWDDVDFALRLLNRTPKIVKLDGQHVDVYRHENSITGLDYTSRATECLKALDRISIYASEGLMKDVELKRTILAANLRAEGTARGDGIFLDIIKNAQGRRHRLALRAAYAYTSRGFRGIARIIHPLM